jgi:hypothetical protein
VILAYQELGEKVYLHIDYCDFHLIFPDSDKIKYQIEITSELHAFQVSWNRYKQQERC